ncbi:hypothetical protein B7463_g1657, partial [Scytalidium lignicola]
MSRRSQTFTFLLLNWSLYIKSPFSFQSIIEQGVMDLLSVVHQNGPVILVHKGWNKENSKSDGPSNRQTSRAIPRESEESESDLNPGTRKLEFINATGPSRHKDPDVRRLVRSHVVKGSSRRRMQCQQANVVPGEKKSRPPTKHKAQISNPERLTSVVTEGIILSQGNNACKITRGLAQNSTPSLGLDPHFELSEIIHRIIDTGRAMWPLEQSLGFNPMSPIGWFDWALSDQALFHALLYTTYSYASLISGITGNREAMVHLGKSLNLVKERLKTRELLPQPAETMVMSEGTIGAVSCMAITEALQGNFDGWRIHMIGIKEMIGTRGVTELSCTLQAKLQR